MSYEHLLRMSNEKVEALHRERQALTQASQAGRSQLARAIAAGLRRLAASLDGEPAPRVAAAR